MVHQQTVDIADVAVGDVVVASNLHAEVVGDVSFVVEEGHPRRMRKGWTLPILDLDRCSRDVSIPNCLRFASRVCYITRTANGTCFSLIISGYIDKIGFCIFLSLEIIKKQFIQLPTF